MRETLNQCIALANRYGDAYWTFASLMFLQVILLVASLFCLDLLLRRRVRAVVRYWIWLLILLKLVLPTGVRTPASIAYWLPASQTAPSQDESPPTPPLAVDLTAGQSPALDSALGGPADPSSFVAAEDSEKSNPGADSPATVAQPVAAVPLAHVGWKALVCGGWLVATAVLFGLLWQKARKVRRLVAEAVTAPADLQRLLGECLTSVSLTPGRIRLKITDRLGSPAICGVFTPTILLPSLGLEKLDRDQIRLVFLHELLHWKRGDLPVNWLQSVLQILYFYNPAVWIAGAMVRRLREEAVDEAVLVMTRGDAQRYATTLLDLAAFSLRPDESMLRLIGVVESRAALAGRIQRIVERPIPKTSKVGLTGLAAILAIGLLFVPMARSERPVAKQRPVTASDAGPPADGPARAEAPADGKKSTDEAKSAMSGRIVDDTGAPVTDATIELTSSRNWELVTGKTDEEGRYALGKAELAGEYRIAIVSQRWVGIHNRDAKTIDLVAGSPVVRDFTLPRGCRLRIDVVNEDGKPVPDVQIYSNLPSDEEYASSEAVITDRQGRALLGGLKPAAGEKRLIATLNDQYALAHLDVLLDNPAIVAEQRIVLKKGHSVEGRALCSDGKPAAGWRINAIPVWWRLGVSPIGQVIQPDGSFELLHVDDDRYDVRISVPSGESGGTPRTVVADTSLPADEEPLNVTIEHPSPTAMTKIVGHIEYQGGMLQSGIHVMAFSTKGSFHGQAFLGPGQTEFDLGPVPAGTYTINFNSLEIEAPDLGKIIVPSKPLDVKIVVRGTLSLRGTVMDAATGDPVPKFSIQVTKQGTLRGPNFAQKPDWHQFAGEQGAFAVDIVGPGIYSLNVTADGFTPATLEAINTDTGPTKDLRIALSAGQSLRGTVVDEHGQPIDGARVVPFLPAVGAPDNDKQPSKEQRSVLTAQGVFTIGHFAFGKEQLQVTHPDYAVAIVPSVALPPDNGSEPLKITLGQGATVRGHVYDNEGKPVANTAVYFDRQRYRAQATNDRADELATVITDGQGFYEARHLPEDDCYVSRADVWTTLGVVRQMIRTQNGKTATLDFGGTAKVSGRLIVNGAAVANSKVLISGESPNYGALRACAQTDGEGGFVFRGIPAGQRTLYYWPTAGERDGVQAKTFDVSTEVTDLGSVELTLVRVAVLKPQSVDDEIYLEQASAKWQFGNSTPILRPSRNPADELSFEHVPLGKYELVCNRPKQFIVRQAVEVSAAREQLVEFKVPAGTASLNGKCDKSICVIDGFPSLFVWSKDQRLLSHIVPKEDGTYRLENIPAGEYDIRRYVGRDADVILTVSLDEGEAKALDITPANTSLKSTRPTGYRYVSVYTDDGLILPGCDVSFPGADHPPELRSSQDGQLLFVGKEGARYEMAVAYHGFKSVRQTLALRPIGTGRPVEDVFLRLFLQPE